MPTKRVTKPAPRAARATKKAAPRLIEEIEKIQELLDEPERPPLAPIEVEPKPEKVKEPDPYEVQRCVVLHGYGRVTKSTHYLDRYTGHYGIYQDVKLSDARRWVQEGVGKLILLPHDSTESDWKAAARAADPTIDFNNKATMKRWTGTRKQLADLLEQYTEDDLIKMAGDLRRTLTRQTVPGQG
jgi:hypothetical protein